MKKKLIAITSVILGAGVLFAFGSKDSNVKNSTVSAKSYGEKIQFTATDLNGKQITDEIFSKNKITMLNIWATFCGPCINEMPDLAKLNKANKSAGVEIVGVVIDITDGNGNLMPEQKKLAESIISKTGANYKHIVPSKEMMGGLLQNIMAVPTTIFVDSNGNQLDSPYLGSRTQKQWQQIIDSFLN